MRRVALAPALLLAACSPQKPAAEAGSAAEPVAIAPAAPVAASATAAGSLTGQTSALSAATSALKVRVTDTSRIVELPTDTLFAFDSAELAPGADENLGKTADLIRQGGQGDLQILGHTDAKGSDDYNQALSERRAEAVANWLRQQVGVRQRTIVAEGRGEKSPIAANARPDGSDDPDGRARNRRVEVVIPR